MVHKKEAVRKPSPQPKANSGARGQESKKKVESSPPPAKLTAMETTPPPSKNLHGLRPHFMRPTSSSDAKKDHRVEVSWNQSPSSCSNSNRRSDASGSRSSRSVKKPMARVVCQNLQVSRATCSSTMKASTFPDYLELNPGGTDVEGTSVDRVCPYNYCSLNGHHHEPLTPLKSFLATRRRMIKSQKTMKIEGASPLRKRCLNDEDGAGSGRPVTSRRPSGLKIFPLMEEAVNDFFVEIYTSRDKEFEKKAEHHEIGAEDTCPVTENIETGLGIEGLDHCNGDPLVDNLDAATKFLDLENHNQNYVIKPLEFEDSVKGGSAVCGTELDSTKAADISPCGNENDHEVLCASKDDENELCVDGGMNVDSNGNENDDEVQCVSIDDESKFGADNVENDEQFAIKRQDELQDFVEDNSFECDTLLKLIKIPEPNDYANENYHAEPCMSKDDENKFSVDGGMNEETSPADSIAEICTQVDSSGDYPYNDGAFQEPSNQSEENDDTKLKSEFGNEFVDDYSGSDMSLEDSEEPEYGEEVSSPYMYNSDESYVQEEFNDGLEDSEEPEYGDFSIPYREKLDESDFEEENDDNVSEDATSVTASTELKDYMQSDDDVAQASNERDEEYIDDLEVEDMNRVMVDNSCKADGSDDEQIADELSCNDTEDRYEGEPTDKDQTEGEKSSLSEEQTVHIEIHNLSPGAQSQDNGAMEDNLDPSDDQAPEGCHDAIDNICAAFSEMRLKDDGTNTDADTGGVYRNRIIIARRRRLPGELEHMKGFNPRAPNFLELEPDPDAETVDLRHQMMDERRNAEEWMIDYALRRAVNQLAPARKKKVELLVEAFETVSPVHGRPIQACS